MKSSQVRIKKVAATFVHFKTNSLSPPLATQALAELIYCYNLNYYNLTICVEERNASFDHVASLFSCFFLLCG